jgi:hypothetical protein
LPELSLGCAIVTGRMLSTVVTIRRISQKPAGWNLCRLTLCLRGSGLPRPRSEFFLVTIKAVGFDLAVYPPSAEFLAFRKDGALNDFDTDMVAAATWASDFRGEHAVVSAQDLGREKVLRPSSPTYWRRG